MVSLSIGHYGALRYHYNDLRAWDDRRIYASESLSPAADSRYRIFTPWVTRSAAPGPDLRPEDRLQNQFQIPVMRKDVNKNHKFEIDWETKIYDPLDQRTKSVPSRPRAVAAIPCPAASHEPIEPVPESLYKIRNPPAKYGVPMKLVPEPFHSSAATRSEEWSTLRQMLPSTGPQLTKRSSENWGTGEDYLPKYATTGHGAAAVVNQPQNFPRINSAMSRYAHDAYFHDRMHKMF